jgi:hypothetical protein
VTGGYKNCITRAALLALLTKEPNIVVTKTRKMDLAEHEVYMRTKEMHTGFSEET